MREWSRSVVSDSAAVAKTAAYQAPPSVGSSRREHWSGCHFLLQGIFPTQGSNLGLPIVGRHFTVWATREVLQYVKGPGENMALVLGTSHCRWDTDHSGSWDDQGPRGPANPASQRKDRSRSTQFGSHLYCTFWNMQSPLSQAVVPQPRIVSKAIQTRQTTSSSTVRTDLSWSVDSCSN